MTTLNLNSQITLDKPLSVSMPALIDEPNKPGHAAVFERLLPQLYGRGDKKQKQLQKVDHYMLLETKELYNRLQRFCLLLGIDSGCEFKIARDGDGLQIIGDIPRARDLTQLVNADAWFVDSFIWLQPNYAMLAHSFEMLEFSEYYEKAPNAARRKYAHFERADKGVLFALRYQHGHVNAQVETPVNLYNV